MSRFELRQGDGDDDVDDAHDDLNVGALQPLDIADTAYLHELSACAEVLRAKAEQLGPDVLAGVLDSDAAQRLCSSATAWLGGDTLPAHELALLAAHVAGGAEVWGGLGSARSFLRVPLLWSRLDPAGAPAFELGIAAIPPRRVDRVPVSLRSRPDPDLVLDLEHPLRLVRQDTLMLCIDVVPTTATVDEATETLSLHLEG